ncbi:uncharacterized protein EMH_0027330 [Eimeria mitis]|uniref:Uncharacterized protein n=1 Tax=Eimeria mitis TaxID=44415 RepID=U6JN09_9EIME|nr:uncharacterized protein EMH_0027330 [Eimeria mitis]CDJ26889.1 hypothetical protein EMH_0027330 [Eimeria mitis]
MFRGPACTVPSWSLATRIRGPPRGAPPEMKSLDSFSRGAPNKEETAGALGAPTKEETVGAPGAPSQEATGGPPGAPSKEETVGAPGAP